MWNKKQIDSKEEFVFWLLSEGLLKEFPVLFFVSIFQTKKPTFLGFSFQ